MSNAYVVSGIKNEGNGTSMAVFRRWHSFECKYRRLYFFLFLISTPSHSKCAVATTSASMVAAAAVMQFLLSTLNLRLILFLFYLRCVISLWAIFSLTQTKLNQHFCFIVMIILVSIHESAFKRNNNFWWKANKILHFSQSDKKKMLLSENWPKGMF